MDRTNAGDQAPATARPDSDVEAIEFVRFCHRRRRVGWPELYDEMCAVAGRNLYRGYGQDDLATIGIGFGLFEMPALAGLVARVVEEDLERRRRSAAAIQASLVVDAAAVAHMARTVAQPGPVGHRVERERAEANESAGPNNGAIRVAVPAGA